jgi:outer membrane protein W
MKVVAAFAVAVAMLSASTASAQPDEPIISIRPFVMVTGEQFDAQTTFDAAFGRAMQPLWGGGVQITTRMGVFGEVVASRFKRTGERAFVNGGEVFHLGIPLTATFTPIEVTAGYRFHLDAHPRLLPYIAAGVGSYSYKETSAFAEAGENVNVRHAGYVANGGVEVRLHQWLGVSGDVQFSHVPGIFGSSGVSKQAGEADLGGVAARIKLIVGR